MADELVPMRQAMGEAYLGDTVMAKQLFASPATFDQRVISLLSGLGQAAETPTAQAISGDNIKAVMAALDLTDNAKRIQIIHNLISLASSNPQLSSELVGEVGNLSSLKLNAFGDISRELSAVGFHCSVRRYGFGPFGFDLRANFQPLIDSYGTNATAQKLSFAFRVPYSDSNPLFKAFLDTCIQFYRHIPVPSVYCSSSPIPSLDDLQPAAPLSGCSISFDTTGLFLPVQAGTAVLRVTLLSDFIHYYHAAVENSYMSWPNNIYFSTTIMPLV